MGNEMNRKAFEYIGKRHPRTDAVQQLTGTCKYGDDYFLPNMLIAKARYSDYAHAKILKIDTSEAEAMPGVAAVITHKDVPCNEYGNGNPPDQRVLAEDRVRYRGDCIAVVAAETRQQAEAAAKAIRVEYEPLPVIKNMQEALAPDAPLIHPEYPNNIAKSLEMSIGNIDEGFEQADMIVEEVYHTQKVDHTPIEPRVALAEPTSNGGVHVIASNSRVFNFIYPLTQILKMPMSKVRMTVPEGIGGSFGGKNDLLLEPWVALLALKTKRPVKMTFTREEDMNTSTIRHAYEIRHCTAVKKDGTILADKIAMTCDTGAYFAIGVGQLLKAMVHCCGPYKITNIQVKGSMVFTNMLNASAMRGMGIPQSCYAWESHLDLIAERLNMDPLELRRKNLFDDEGMLVNGQVLDSRAARACFEKALKLFEESEVPPVQKNKKRGIGVANMIYPHDSSGPSGATSVFVKVDADGSAVIYNGLSDVGQGSKTALSQIAAEVLGIPMEKITFINGDTRMTPYDEGTGASRTTFFCGRCVQSACEKAREILFETAGRILGIPDSRKFYIKDGEIYLKTFPEYHVSVEKAAFAAERIYGHPAMASASFSSYSTPMNEKNGHALLYERHTYGTQIAQVDVDITTGEIDVLKLVAVHSCGTVINPMLVEGQIYGGVQMGLGQALMEHMHEKDDGSVLTNSFSEYHILTAADMPRIMIADTVECPVEDGPFGAGGMSEGAPSPTAPAVGNAVADALGVRYTSLPLNPERILMGWKQKTRHNEENCNPSGNLPSKRSDSAFGVDVDVTDV